MRLCPCCTRGDMNAPPVSIEAFLCAACGVCLIVAYWAHEQANSLSTGSCHQRSAYCRNRGGMQLLHKKWDAFLGQLLVCQAHLAKRHPGMRLQACSTLIQPSPGDRPDAEQYVCKVCRCLIDIFLWSCPSPSAGQASGIGTYLRARRVSLLKVTPEWEQEWECQRADCSQVLQAWATPMLAPAL